VGIGLETKKLAFGPASVFKVLITKIYCLVVLLSLSNIEYGCDATELFSFSSY